MTTKEKRLLWLAGLMFGGYFLPFVAGPAALDFYRQQTQSLIGLQDEIQRYQRLGNQADTWRDKHAQALKNQAEIQASLLEGSTRELVATRLQGILNDGAQASGVQVRSLDVPEFTSTQNWLLVTQAVQFSSNSQQIYDLVKILQEHKTRLAIILLDLRNSGGVQLSGTLKVTGFSPAVGG
jgi:hypothetical protein